MDLTNLEKTLKTEPSFRLKQAKKAVFVNLIDDWNKATGLPAILREKLNKECPLAINANTLESKDKQTAKAVIILKDGLKIESVLMRHRDGRNTICVSSQVGCALGCAFCLTGKKGFKRNLEPMEIVEQVLFFARYLKISQVSLPSLDEEGAGGGADKNPKHHPTLILPSTEGRRNQRIDNVVFMGMGEPFLNFGNVMQAIKILNDKDSLNIG
ncbi:MAG: hypothetical protein HY764_01335, partial [Candidatus Portnoybacteria bacterium]|nr:hypothetical protein [Candidatus Portnoybacteria bacterium]